MKLIDVLEKMDDGDELTVIDKDYDIETYFYNQVNDDWDKAMMKLAGLLEVEKLTSDYASVNLYDLIDSNIKSLKESDLFYEDIDADSIMDDIESILAGNVSEKWLVKFVDALEGKGE